MKDKWSILLSDFRQLGGIADNILQKNGENGRGIFSVSTEIESKVFVPSNLMIKKDDVYLKDNKLRIKKEKAYSIEIRRFFNFYQDHFSWGGGGRKDTEYFEQGLKNFPDKLKLMIKQNFLVNLAERHRGNWDEIILREFLNSRVLKYRQDRFIVPIWELINHDVNYFPFSQKYNGVKTPIYPLKNDELTFYYGDSSPIMRFFKYGFFSKETIIFSIPLKIQLNRSKVNLHCKGRDIVDEKFPIEINNSEIIIKSLPITDIYKTPILKIYIEDLKIRYNIKEVSNSLIGEILKYNYKQRKNILKEVKLVNNHSSIILKKTLDYEIDLIKDVLLNLK